MPTYDLISRTTLSSAATSVTFSSITGSYADLIIAGYAGNSTYSTNDFTDLRIQFNSDTATNYSWTRIQGNGSTASSSRGSTTSFILAGTYPISNNSNYFGSILLQVNDYANTTTYKTLIGRSGIPQGSGSVTANVGLWRSTSAITSVTITSDGSWPYMAGSTFSLFGIAG